MTEETYLGDGLYASFDGYQFTLRAPQLDGGNQEVYLERHVMDQFMDYIGKKLSVKIWVESIEPEAK